MYESYLLISFHCIDSWRVEQTTKSKSRLISIQHPVKVPSMDWFVGEILTGNHRFSHEVWGFPVKIVPNKPIHWYHQHPPQWQLLVPCADHCSILSIPYAEEPLSGGRGWQVIERRLISPSQIEGTWRNSPGYIEIHIYIWYIYIYTITYMIVKYYKWLSI